MSKCSKHDIFWMKTNTLDKCLDGVCVLMRYRALMQSLGKEIALATRPIKNPSVTIPQL